MPRDFNPSALAELADNARLLAASALAYSDAIEALVRQLAEGSLGTDPVEALATAEEQACQKMKVLAPHDPEGAAIALGVARAAADVLELLLNAEGIRLPPNPTALAGVTVLEDDGEVD